MKTQISVLLIALFTGTASFAQNSSVAEMPKVGDVSSHGVRVSILIPMVEVQSKYDYRFGTISSNDKPDSAMGVSIGYVSLPVQQIGWTANAAYLNAKFGDRATGIYRADGNLAYAFNNTLNLKGGVNVGKIDDSSYGDLHSGLGFQASLGVQVSKNFGADLGYMQMNQTGSSNDIKSEIKISGMEIGLNGTF